MAKRFAALADMPPKRKDTEDTEDTEDTAASSKRFRSAIGESIEEFKCPITNELPLDPVLAEDGKVYERSAIETWLQNNQRSPLTNEAIGNRLTPATQIKNIIKCMVEGNALPEDKVKAWKKRIAEQDEVAELRTKAEGGDAEAAYELGRWLEDGKKGLRKDHAKAFAMYQQSAKGGHAKGMGALASSYYHGRGVEMNDALALRWGAAGAALDNGRAMVTLGNMYANGRGGLPKDYEEALKLRMRGYERSHSNSGSLYRLAQMFEKGKGTSIDMDKAAYWMRKAVACNSPPGTFAQQARGWLLNNCMDIDGL